MSQKDKQNISNMQKKMRDIEKDKSKDSYRAMEKKFSDKNKKRRKKNWENK